MTLRSQSLLASVVLSRDARFYRRLRDSFWLYLALVLLADEDGIARQSFAELAEATGLKEATLRSWSGHLRKLGLIRIRAVTDRGTDPEVFQFKVCGLRVPECKTKRESHTREHDRPDSHDSRPEGAADPTDRGKASPRPTAELEALAYAIAEGLGDEENVEHYVALCETVPMDVLRRAFEQAQRTPAEKIRKSRGALFTYLVHQYAQNTKNQ